MRAAKAGERGGEGEGGGKGKGGKGKGEGKGRGRGGEEKEEEGGRGRRGEAPTGLCKEAKLVMCVTFFVTGRIQEHFAQSARTDGRRDGCQNYGSRGATFAPRHVGR